MKSSKRSRKSRINESSDDYDIEAAEVRKSKEKRKSKELRKSKSREKENKEANAASGETPDDEVLHSDTFL